MKSAVSGIFNKIPKKENSHVRGWALTWSENLGVPLLEDPQPVNTLYLDHGANFTGGLNLFGGFTQDLKDRIDIMLRCNEVISLDREMPDYGKMLKKRKDVVDKDWCDTISEKCLKATSLISSDLKTDWLAVGDSHTAAYSRAGSAVIKRDGTTLNNQINSDFDYIKEHVNKRKWKGVTISLGNIDVRFHIHRLGADVGEMIKAYGEFGKSLNCEVEYALPWPIEHEDRKIPGTGKYKGEPFYGTRQERLDIIYQIRSFMDKFNMQYVSCPESWYKMDGKEYAKKIMESNGSVHLNPNYYRRRNWGVSENSLENFM
jgi:hypothetical protein